MKIKELTEKYNINYEEFIEFMWETGLHKKPNLVKLKLFGQAEISDDFVSECVAIFKADQGITKDNYFLTSKQQDELHSLVGKEITCRLSDKQIEEFDKMGEEFDKMDGMEKIGEFLKNNVPDYEEIVSHVKFEYIRELEKKKIEGMI